MGKPDNQNIDIETLRRQLRQEFDERVRFSIGEALDARDEGENGAVSLVLSDSDPEDATEEDLDDDNTSATKPFIDVKFRNARNVLTRPTEANAFGKILKSSDGTLSVNVDGKIEDDQTGIEKYKIRIKRID